MDIRTTELGYPVEIFTVLIEVQHYGLIVVPCSSEDRAEYIVEQAYQKYVNVMNVDIQRSYVDDWNEDIDWIH